MPSESLEKILSYLKHNPNCETLEITNDKLNDYDTWLLAIQLRENRNLRSIKLTNVDLNAIRFEIIYNAVKDHPNLSKLDLSNNPLEIAKLGTILKTLLSKNSQITYLNLAKTMLDDVAGKLLVECLLRNDSLKELDLSNNNLGTEGGRTLAAAMLLITTLKKINLTNNFQIEPYARGIVEQLSQSRELQPGNSTSELEEDMLLNFDAANAVDKDSDETKSVSDSSQVNTLIDLINGHQILMNSDQHGANSARFWDINSNAVQTIKTQLPYFYNQIFCLANGQVVCNVHEVLNDNFNDPVFKNQKCIVWENKNTQWQIVNTLNSAVLWLEYDPKSQKLFAKFKQSIEVWDVHSSAWALEQTIDLSNYERFDMRLIANQLWISGYLSSEKKEVLELWTANDTKWQLTNKFDQARPEIIDDNRPPFGDDPSPHRHRESLNSIIISENGKILISCRYGILDLWTRNDLYDTWEKNRSSTTPKQRLSVLTLLSDNQAIIQYEEYKDEDYSDEDYITAIVDLNDFSVVKILLQSKSKHYFLQINPSLFVIGMCVDNSLHTSLWYRGLNNSVKQIQPAQFAHTLALLNEASSKPYKNRNFNKLFLVNLDSFAFINSTCDKVEIFKVHIHFSTLSAIRNEVTKLQRLSHTLPAPVAQQALRITSATQSSTNGSLSSKTPLKFSINSNNSNPPPATPSYLIQKGNAQLRIVYGNVLNMPVKAIVNAANESLAEGGGICGAIFKLAGSAQLTQECKQLKHCPTGQAVITDSYQLKKRGIERIIHAVGPIWDNYPQLDQAKTLLENAYLNSLILAEKNNISSIAFPAISCGLFAGSHNPLNTAPTIAINTACRYLDQNRQSSIKEIMLVCYTLQEYQAYVKAMQNLPLAFMTEQFSSTQNSI